MTQPTAPRHPGAARRRGIAAWVDPRHRRLGSWAFLLNRLSGVGLLLYLYLHLVVLSLLVRGPDSWDAFVAIATNPVVLAFDVVLLAGLLVHGFNGIRVTLVGLGLLVDRQRVLFVAVVVVAGIIAIAAGARIFGVTSP